MTDVTATAAFDPRVVRDASLWTEDASCEPLLPGASWPPGQVRWIDVLPGADPEATLREVGPLCDDEITLDEIAMVLNLDRDERGCYDSPDGDVRVAHAVAVQAVPPAPGDAGSPLVGTLRVQPVSVAVGDGWLLTCWHDTRCYRGADPVECADTSPVVAPGACRGAVQRRWREHHAGRTAADLGVLVLHELALTYASAHRGIGSWLEAWELELYRDNRLDRDALPVLWGSMALLRDWLSPLNRAGVSDDIDKAWFRGATSQAEVNRVDDRIDHALSGLSELAKLLRASFAMEQSRLDEAARRRDEQRQQRVEYIAAIFLVPAFVVGFFGANTKLPGGATWEGFAVMLAALVLLTVGAVAALRRLNRSAED